MDRGRGQGSSGSRIQRLRDGCRHGWRRRWSFHFRINQRLKAKGWKEIQNPRSNSRIKQTAFRYGNKRTRSYGQQTPKVCPARTKQVGQGFRIRQACTHYETKMDVGRKEKGRKDRATIVVQEKDVLAGCFWFWFWFPWFRLGSACGVWSPSLEDRILDTVWKLQGAVYGYVCILSHLYTRDVRPLRLHRRCIAYPFATISMSAIYD